MAARHRPHVRQHFRAPTGATTCLTVGVSLRNRRMVEPPYGTLRSLRGSGEEGPLLPQAALPTVACQRLSMIEPLRDSGEPSADGVPAQKTRLPPHVCKPAPKGRPLMINRGREPSVDVWRWCTFPHLHPTCGSTSEPHRLLRAPKVAAHSLAEGVSLRTTVCAPTPPHKKSPQALLQACGQVIRSRGDWIRTSDNTPPRRVL